MRVLNNLLQEMVQKIPGTLAASIVGSDGLFIASHLVDLDFKLDVAAAQLSLIMRLVLKTANLFQDEIEDDLISAETIHLLTFNLQNNGQYFLCIAVDKNCSRLGNVRLIVRDYLAVIRDALPHNYQ
ncbi:hypothetical protein JW964_08665 [candidate division KSB1 bacterium]|nr:hypothetical protein [candidate division KSB1 bacterium]